MRTPHGEHRQVTCCSLGWVTLAQGMSPLHCFKASARCSRPCRCVPCKVRDAGAACDCVRTHGAKQVDTVAQSILDAVQKQDVLVVLPWYTIFMVVLQVGCINSGLCGCGTLTHVALSAAGVRARSTHCRQVSSTRSTSSQAYRLPWTSSRQARHSRMCLPSWTTRTALRTARWTASAAL